MKYSESLEAFLGFLRKAQEDYDIAVSVEQDANDATQDILHSLELDENRYHDQARLAAALRATRQKRRRAKDTRAQLQPVVDWAKQNGKTVKSLELLLGQVRKAEKSSEGRYYHQKTDIVAQVLEKNSVKTT